MKNPNIELLLFIKHLIGLRARTKEEIADLWSERNDAEINVRTINRNVEFLKELGYEIQSGYDNRKRTYRLVDDYENEIVERIENHLRISKMPGLANPDNVASPPVQQGIEMLPLLLESINNRNAVAFTYHPFDKDPSPRKVCPVILKEYQGKWHLHGFNLETNKYRTYGIDRIKELKQKGKYNWDSLPELEKEIDLFKSRLGASMPVYEYFKGREVKREIIKLRVSSFYLSYLKSKPLHQSQKITDDVIKAEKFTSGELLDYTLVNFYLVPNYDLIKFVVSQLGDVLIEEPKSLKEYVGNTFNGLIAKITP